MRTLCLVVAVTAIVYCVTSADPEDDQLTRTAVTNAEDVTLFRPGYGCPNCGHGPHGWGDRRGGWMRHHRGWGYGHRGGWGGGPNRSAGSWGGRRMRNRDMMGYGRRGRWPASTGDDGDDCICPFDVPQNPVSGPRNTYQRRQWERMYANHPCCSEPRQTVN